MAPPVKFDSPEQFLNSEYLKEIRTQVSTGQWPNSCAICKKKHSAGLPNDTTNWDNNYASAGSPSLDLPNVLFLDLRTSNMCNLKCRMCGPESSSQWNTELKDHTELQNWMSPIDDTDKSNFEYFLSLDLIQIKLLGGEPTIDKKVISFIEQLAESGRSLPQLRFTTNGTNLNAKFRKSMSKFDNIHVVFSVDAVGDVFEYIRTNASWPHVEKNIITVFKKDLASQYGFNTILTPYNIFGLVELLKWYESLYNHGYKFGVSFTDSNSDFNSIAAVLPHHLGQEIDKLNAYVSTVSSRFVEDVPGIDTLITVLNSAKFDQTVHNKFKKFNNTLDTVRKTNLSAIDSRFADYQ